MLAINRRIVLDDAKSNGKALLSEDALTLILDTAPNSIRAQCNIALRDGLLGDCQEAVLDAGWNENEELLSEIYYFAYGIRASEGDV